MNERKGKYIERNKHNEGRTLVSDRYYESRNN